MTFSYANQRILVEYTHENKICIIHLNSPQRRNAVDREMAEGLNLAIINHIEKNDQVHVGILHGKNKTFCSGADLKAIAEGNRNKTEFYGNSPMGPCRLSLSKPMIAAITGSCVAGGMEIALWCDLRIAENHPTVIFGALCRRWGVPLIDGGTVRLPRLIGHSRAMDLILTGRSVSASEAESIGLVNRLVPEGKALEAAIQLAQQVSSFPQEALRGDRLSSLEAWNMHTEDALRNEMRHGKNALSSKSMLNGTQKFAQGAGRHASFKYSNNPGQIQSRL
eukprot:gb/GECH01000123.1/.p1 GENE.gb/GECH01000123.1/~~gb/GECH01000123.1/.p1  ORF type:complete len:279 (+),score=71.53 gb/GECH01000123.1/:1-837(+)